MNHGILGAFIGAILSWVFGKNGGPVYSALLFFLLLFTYILIEKGFFDRKLKRMRFTYSLVIKLLIWFWVIFWSLLIVVFLFCFQHGWRLLEDPDGQYFNYVMKEFDAFKIKEIVLIIFVIFSFIQVNALLGKGVLMNYLIGKYHKPRLEERIFMFIDIADSTSIAEQLGALKYSSFVQKFFNDIDSAITDVGGTIVQYVGDEVVVVWKSEIGLKNNNCVQAFVNAERAIREIRRNYQYTFGAYPKFKAAAHIGEITVAEVGSSKREIAYHGDTINTTSRILSMCNKLKSNFLISKALYQQLSLDYNIKATNEGTHQLKGKENEIEIYSLSTYLG